RGELGEIPDAHQHLRIGIPTPHFRVSLERRHEAEADRLENRIDQIADTPLFQLLDARIERVESATEIWHDDDTGASQVARDVEIRAVHAQHELRTGGDGRADLFDVERVDADAHAG